MGAPVVVDAEPAWHRAADLAVVLGADVGDTSDAEGKMCFDNHLEGSSIKRYSEMAEAMTT